MDEMKVCPHCQTVMEEKPGWDGDLKTPQLPADDQPPALKATRVRWECPKCPHIEESLPQPNR
jgi:transposase